MIARLLAIAIVIASAVGLVALAVLEGLEPGIGLAITLVVLYVGFHVMTAAARPRLIPRHLLAASSWEAHRWKRGLPSIWDRLTPGGATYLERLRLSRQYSLRLGDRLRTEAHMRERQATRWLGRVPQPGDRKRWTPEELTRGADIDAILAEEEAHNRLGL